MRAKIVEVNPNRGLYIFQRDDDEFGYFEILDSIEPEVGEELIGSFNNLGGETVTLVSTKEKIDIFIQDFCSLQIAKSMILNSK